MLRSLFYFLLQLPLKLFVKTRIIPETPNNSIAQSDAQPIFYVIRHQSASDLLTLQNNCKKLNLPDPLQPVEIAGEQFCRTFFLEKPRCIFPWSNKSPTSAIQQGLDVLKHHQENSALDAQLVPVNLTWGRQPAKEKATPNLTDLLTEQESPSWLKKLFIVIFLGRNTLIRFSEPVSFRYMSDKHGNDEAAAQKLLRVARFHFHRQTIAATGPRLMHRKQMFNALLANPSIKRLISDEVKSKSADEKKIKKEALAIMDEIAGDYSQSMVQFGERLLNKLWKRLYNKIEISNAGSLRKLAEDGHEIIYVPCHRSHMDYLLLTSVIYQQGLVIPRIAAGINLSFWPAGPIFRKSGAFFIRRSFKGNRLYSTIFREYLGLLFERGYSVKYYTEGGRSRTGRLLKPKTGMLAMTIQSLLRGIDRPLTLVPVYIGYEHIMEVGTYHKELSGSSKKTESIFGVFKAIKSLRNYGNGYINFGEPININQFLNKQVPDWKNDIDPVEPQKPSWLTPNVNLLADQVMTSVNKATALNPVALVALILHASEHKALPKHELANRIDFFIMLQKIAPYSNQLTLPSGTGAELVEHVIALKKVTLDKDERGEIISLSKSATIETRYYRNNILHCFILPSIVLRLLEKNAKLSHQTLIFNTQRLISILKSELFLWQNETDIQDQVTLLVNELHKANLIQKDESEFWLLGNTAHLADIRAVAECSNESIQRISVVSALIIQQDEISRNDLTDNVVDIAKRLSILNNINAPEFIDKKTQSELINTLKDLEYLAINPEGKYYQSEKLSSLKIVVDNLIDKNVLDSINSYTE